MDNLKKFLDNEMSDQEWLDYCKTLKDSAEEVAIDTRYEKKKFIINE